MEGEYLTPSDRYLRLREEADEILVEQFNEVYHKLTGLEMSDKLKASIRYALVGETC